MNKSTFIKCIKSLQELTALLASYIEKWLNEKLIGIQHILNIMVLSSYRLYLKYFIHLRNNFHAGVVSG